MSRNVLLVLPSVLKERTVLHTNVDDKLLYPEIKAAQDLYIMPLLGSALFKKLQDDIEATGTTTGAYLTLLEDYIIDCICNYVLAELPEGLNYQFFNKGLSGKTTPESTTPSMSDMYQIVAKYKSRAEHYAKRARKYLLQNAVASFPEYYQIQTGIDTVIPERDDYQANIYLGEFDERKKDDYSLQKRQPPYNSNDPYWYE